MLLVLVLLENTFADFQKSEQTWRKWQHSNHANQRCIKNRPVSCHTARQFSAAPASATAIGRAQARFPQL
jgi:hypothetical protein